MLVLYRGRFVLTLGPDCNNYLHLRLVFSPHFPCILYPQHSHIAIRPDFIRKHLSTSRYNYYLFWHLPFLLACGHQ